MECNIVTTNIDIPWKSRAAFKLTRIPVLISDAAAAATISSVWRLRNPNSSVSPYRPQALSLVSGCSLDKGRAENGTGGPDEDMLMLKD